MLSQKVLTLFDLQFRLATAIKCIPFAWDNRRSIIKLVPLRRHTIAHYLSLVNMTLDFIYTAVCCIGYFFYISAKSNVAETVPIIIYNGVLIVSAVLIYLARKYQLEFMTLANKLIQNNSYVARALDLQHQRYDRALEIFWEAGAAMSVVTPAVLYSFLTKPDGDENLYTFYIAKDPYGRYAFAIISTIVLANKWMVVQTMVVLAFALMLTLRIWLKIMLTKYEKDELKAEEAIGMHNCIQIFSAMNKTTFTWLLFPLGLVTISVIAVLGLSSLISNYRDLKREVLFILLEAMVICMIGLYVLFDLIREATGNSQQLLTSLDLHCAQSKYLKRRVKACIPYSIQFGSLFKAKAVTVLTVFGFILQNTISLVIMNKT